MLAARLARFTRTCVCSRRPETDDVTLPCVRACSLPTNVVTSFRSEPTNALCPRLPRENRCPCVAARAESPRELLAAPRENSDDRLSPNPRPRVRRCAWVSVGKSSKLISASFSFMPAPG